MWDPGRSDDVTGDHKCRRNRRFDFETRVVTRGRKGMPDEPSLYIFECPLNKTTVKVLADASIKAPCCRLRWIVPCVACGRWHAVNVATGRVRVTAIPSQTAEPAPRAAG